MQARSTLWSLVRGGPRVLSGPPTTRSWILLPLFVGLASRVVSIAILAGEALANGLPPTSPFGAWDAVWYVNIAATGYHAELVRGGHDYAFFPAWPLLIKVLSLDGRLDPATMATVAANALFVAAVVLIWRLFTTRIDAAAASGSIALLAFSPASYVFSMGYSESLFLFVAALAFTTVRPASRGATVAVATLVKLLGIAIAASAALEVLLSRGRPRRIAIAAIVGGIVGFSAWWLFIAALTGNPAGFLTGESTWLHGVAPIRVLAETFRAHPVRVVAWFAFAGVVAVGTVLAVMRDRELGVFAGVTVAITIASVTIVPGSLPHSVPRAAVMAFPAFAGLASQLGQLGQLGRLGLLGLLGRLGVPLLLIAFVVLQVVFASWTIGAGSNAP